MSGFSIAMGLRAVLMQVIHAYIRQTIIVSQLESFFVSNPLPSAHALGSHKGRYVGQTEARVSQGIVRPPITSVMAVGHDIVIPRIIGDAGDRAARRFLEFFAATIRNRNTRTAYHHACLQFFAWCDRHQIGGIDDIEPLHVAAYVEVLGNDFSKPTVKQHLAAIRMLFDWMVIGQVVATNPAHAVRGPKHVVKTGKTTVLEPDQARALLDSIDI